MDFDEEQRTSRVVVETPNTRREVTRAETVREPERRGLSTGVVAAMIVAAVALTAIVFMFVMNRESEPVADQRPAALPTPIAPASPPQTVVQQPASVPPTTIIQAPPPPQTAPVIVQQPVPAGEGTSQVIDDGTLQANITNAVMNDSDLATADIIVTVLNAEASLSGSVNSIELKRRAERLAKAVKGIKKVDSNQLTVVAADDRTTPVRP